MLYDNNFLEQLYNFSNKEIYARITAFTFNELPVEYIEGKITQGSVNIDGASSVRRSCSLTMVTEDFNYNEYYWSLNTKFQLEIGLKNYVNDSYSNIIWFKQGIYVITSFNVSQNTTNFNISIQGKDKMSLLNGDLGGVLESSVDFGTIEEESLNGTWIIRKLKLQDIIKNILQTYGRELGHNIIINDLDSVGLELLEYRYDIPLFLYRSPEDTVYANAFLGGDSIEGQVEIDGKIVTEKLSKLPDKYFESLVKNLTNPEEAPIIKIDNSDFCVAKISNGQTAGYRQTDLVYDGDLIANAGDTITSVLDKIKTMLTEFEYFYNVDGQFVFQKKQNIKSSMWQFDDEKIFQNLFENNNYAYEFYNNNLTTSFSNNPNLLNLKNDYSIWGEKESTSGVKIPIHLRYAIDIIPSNYTRIIVEEDDLQLIAYNEKYNTHLQGQDGITFSTDKYDWREIIFQMAQDYFKYNFLDDFELRVAAANPTDYPSGRTGYEQYYTDIAGFWRQLYYPDFDNEELFDKDGNPQQYNLLTNKIKELTEEIFGIPQEGYENNLGGIQNHLIAFKNADQETRDKYMKDWESIYTDDKFKNLNTDQYLGVLNDHYFRKKSDLENKQRELEYLQKKYENVNKEDFYFTDDERKYWNKKIYECPEQLTFWFDFLDGSGEVSKFNTKTIGVRPKVVNDTKIKSIYFKETPSVIYIAPEDQDKEVNNSAFRFIKLSKEHDNMFVRSSQEKSSKNKLDELLQQHTYCIENITFSTIPIYHLQPNTRIYVHDENTGIDGDYIVNKLSLQLSYSGTMSITAVKAVDN